MHLARQCGRCLLQCHELGIGRGDVCGAGCAGQHIAVVLADNAVARHQALLHGLRPQVKNAIVAVGFFEGCDDGLGGSADVR